MADARIAVLKGMLDVLVLRARDTPRPVLMAAYDRLLERARSLPMLESTALTTTPPFWSMAATDFAIPGVDAVAALRSPPLFNAATPEYFRTMGIALLRGRRFASTDVKGAPRVRS